MEWTGLACEIKAAFEEPLTGQNNVETRFAFCAAGFNSNNYSLRQSTELGEQRLRDNRLY